MRSGWGGGDAGDSLVRRRLLDTVSAVGAPPPPPPLSPLYVDRTRSRSLLGDEDDIAWLTRELRRIRGSLSGGRDDDPSLLASMGGMAALKDEVARVSEIVSTRASGFDHDKEISALRSSMYNLARDKDNALLEVINEKQERISIAEELMDLRERYDKLRDEADGRRWGKGDDSLAAALREQVDRLRAENARLRAPLVAPEEFAEKTAEVARLTARVEQLAAENQKLAGVVEQKTADAAIAEEQARRDKLLAARDELQQQAQREADQLRAENAALKQRVATLQPGSVSSARRPSHGSRTADQTHELSSLRSQIMRESQLWHQHLSMPVGPGY
ncbi:hypothetical protein DIPPA_23678 [Diplonema papillatum]|nr:hypothetical protein DIPPA_23678 [Diplonema papillatum]